VKERLQVGVQGRVDVVVEATRNTRRCPSTTRSTAGRRAARAPARADASPAKKRRAAYRFPTDRRGASRSARCARRSRDPFGLVSGSRHVLGAEQVIVYPRVP
jgi:uncharacterized protein (DUF58 family)